MDAQAEALTVVEPDAFANGVDISNAFPGVTLSAFGEGVTPQVFSRTSAFSSTGTQGFGNLSVSSTPSIFWVSPGNQFRADFTNLVNFVSIDVVAEGTVWWITQGADSYNKCNSSGYPNWVR